MAPTNLSVHRLAPRLAGILAALAAASGAAPAPALADEIVMEGRRMANVTVVEETYEKVVYTISGSKQEVSARDVDEVIYAQQPSSYRAGLDLMAKGQFADAAGRFLDSVTGRAGWVDQYALFHAADSFRLAGDPEQAATTYARLLSEHPKTRFYPAAKLGRGLTLAATGDYAGARRVLGELEKEAEQAKLGDRWVARARLETARTHEAEGNVAEAQGLYQRLTRQRLKYADVAAAAELGDLRTQGAKAAPAIERLIDDAKTPDAVRAEAYLALGKAVEASGDAKRALMAFLRVALFPSFERYPEARAEALHRAALAFDKLKVPGAPERAEEMRQRLRTAYPGSPWAK